MANPVSVVLTFGTEEPPLTVLEEVVEAIGGVGLVPEQAMAWAGYPETLFEMTEKFTVVTNPTTTNG